MDNYINYTVFLLFLGGFFSLLLTVIIIISKQEHKRNNERERLNKISVHNPESVGDVEAKLNDSFEYRKPNVMELFTIWGLQPLFIVCFVNLFSIQDTIEVIIAFILTIFIILHEFWTSNQYSKYKAYQFLIIGIWIILFFFISYRTNKWNEAKEKENTEIKQTDEKTTPNTV